MQKSLQLPEPSFNNFTDLVTHMKGMTDDPLYPSGSNMVICRGNPNARVMIIGEAPGTNENREQRPFIGRSGQLMDKMLAAIGWDSEQDIFITNAVFRMPPGVDRPIRKPTKQEMSYYRPYLLEIIRLIDPLVIILAGSVPMSTLLGEKRGITKVRGDWYQWNGRWAMPIFHPAYLLRNPSNEPGKPRFLAGQDMQEIKRKYLQLAGSK